jgi:hypothetical protein
MRVWATLAIDAKADKNVKYFQQNLQQKYLELWQKSFRIQTIYAKCYKLILRTVGARLGHTYILAFRAIAMI